MASAWGSSWGSAWGNSWGAVGAVTATTTTRGGGIPRRRKHHVEYSEGEDLSRDELREIVDRAFRQLEAKEPDSPIVAKVRARIEKPADGPQPTYLDFDSLLNEVNLMRGMLLTYTQIAQIEYDRLRAEQALRQIQLDMELAMFGMMMIS